MRQAKRYKHTTTIEGNRYELDIYLGLTYMSLPRGAKLLDAKVLDVTATRLPDVVMEGGPVIIMDEETVEDEYGDE